MKGIRVALLGGLAAGFSFPMQSPLRMNMCTRLQRGEPGRTFTGWARALPSGILSLTTGEKEEILLPCPNL